MNRVQTGNPPGYDDLPDFLKAMYSPKEYAWLSEGERARLLQTETEPEWTEP